MVDIQTKVLQDLKCAVCQSYLSFSPIMQKANGDSVCGRCVTTDNIEHSTLRMKAYEALASTHLFPCRYDNDGCRTKLHWEDVREHEEDCSYRPYECFMLPPGSCTWTGCRNELMKHFTEDHPENIMNTSEETNIDVSQDFEMNLLTTVFDLLFLIQIKYNKVANKMWHTVRYIGNEKCSMLFKYSFTVISEEEDIIKKRQVEPRNSLYALNDKSHEIDFEVFLECLKAGIKINIDKKFEPKIWKPMECTLCKKYLVLCYTRQTKDGCYCTECAPDNYIIISSSSFTPRCTDCEIGECLEGIEKHNKWLCSAKKKHCYNCINTWIDVLCHYERTHNSNTKLINDTTWESNIYVENRNKFVGILFTNGIKFFVFSEFHDTELRVRIASKLKKSEVEYFECVIKVVNPGTGYNKQTIPKRGTAWDWESCFKWTIGNSLTQKINDNGKFKDTCQLIVNIKQII